MVDALRHRIASFFFSFEIALPHVLGRPVFANPSRYAALALIPDGASCDN
jgi:hypothetical protein